MINRNAIWTFSSVPIAFSIALIAISDCFWPLCLYAICLFPWASGFSAVGLFIFFLSGKNRIQD